MIPENIRLIMQKLLDNNFEAFIVGGPIRDIILGIEPKDWDLFTDASGEQILQLFLQGKILGGEERQAKILTVIVDGVEISQYRNNGDRTETGKDLITHMSTCDFTINSMAMYINEDILDFFGGQSDLAWHRLSFVGNAEQRVKEDPLRLFRGIRFAAKYKLNITHGIVFHEHNKYIQNLPKERIRDELLKIIILENGFEILDEFGMLASIIPEWQKCKNLDGGIHHNESVDTHMFLALNNARKLTNNPLLLLAVFLHDIAKPMSAVNWYDHSSPGTNDDDLTFYNHHTLGEKMIDEWMKDMRFSQKETDYVTAIIKHHMMGKTENISPKTFNKICSDMKNANVTPEDMLVMTFSDNQANLKNPKLTFNEFLINNGFMQRYYETLYTQKGFDENCLEIDGREIMNLGFEAGPIIGVVKKQLFDAVSEGKIINRKDRLIEYVKEAYARGVQ